MVIAQANAQWRRQIATSDTAAVNRANELNANAILDISKTAYDNLWTYYGDTMEWAWTSSENDKDRLTQMALGKLSAETNKSIQQLRTDAEESGAIGGFFSDMLTSQVGGTIIGSIFGCWVAREVYGVGNYDWVIFRDWLFNDAPKWLRSLYLKYGEKFAKFISDKPKTKSAIKTLMDKVVKK